MRNLRRCIFVFVALLAASAAFAQNMRSDYAGVIKTLGKQGDFKDNVLKVNIPRSDVKVTIDGIATRARFGFEGLLAMSKGDSGNDVMIGDLATGFKSALAVLGQGAFPCSLIQAPGLAGCLPALHLHSTMEEET